MTNFNIGLDPAQSSRLGRISRWLTILFCLGLTLNCAARRAPDDLVRPADASLTPLVLLPGTTGSRLREASTGDLVWGDARRLFFPRDGGNRVVIPISPDSDANGDLEPDGLVRGVRILGIELDIYDSLIRRLQAEGYKLGDLSNPQPGDTLFLFPYDWRRSTSAAAGVLAGQLEGLRLARGEEELAVDMLCQSNAARIARWFIKYGGSTLEAAEAGGSRDPSIRVDKLLLVASANGGAMATLRGLNRNRVYSPFGRRFRVETLFTLEALYEALPFFADDLFFDRDGNPLDVDLFDPDNWKRYGWSVYDPVVQRRLLRNRDPELYGSATQRDRHLARSLDRARRLHDRLRQDVPSFGTTRYYSIQGESRPTYRRAMLLERNGRWESVFGDDPRLACDKRLGEIAMGPGDGHASSGSQSYMSPQELAALVHSPVHVPERHRAMMANGTTQDWVVRFLAE